MFAASPLKEVKIGRNLVYETGSGYGYSPFYGSKTLETVVLTDMPTEVFENEFYGCTSLKNVSLGDGVTKIGDYAFSGCSAINLFVFGSNVSSIGQEAFSDCTSMTELYASATNPPTCGTQALDDINKFNCTLYVPTSAVDDYKAAEQWKEFFFVEDGDYTQKSQTITWSQEFSDVKVGDVITLEGTSSVVNEITYEITKGSNIASLNGNKLTITGNGEIEITATQSGNELFEAAEPVVKKIIVSGSTTAVEETSEAERTVVGTYTLDGRKVKGKAEGVKVVVYSDGTSEKVISK